MGAKLILLLLFMTVIISFEGISQNRLTELDAYWSVVKETVEAGDIIGYGMTFHEDGVLVSDSRKSCYTLQVALEKWKDGLEKTKKGITRVNLDFRFSERLGDNYTAFEKGIFRHELISENGERIERYINFDALLVNRDGGWKIMLEHQKLPASKVEWDALIEIKN